HKLQRIEENASRLGIDIIETRLMDAREISGTYEGQADRVLVDAPCSGLGVLRRKPDARWKKKPQDLEALPVLQLAILRSASRAVRPGGVLVYSTCTMGREENQKVVEDFLKECSDFRLDDTGKFLPERARPEQMLQLFPQKDGTDGFFIARMSRAG
ncbi:MAG: 16S rRNA (cytosine(967)-C(5))-methyltransferase RsmB, partial [Selenomonadaceae bacterium]|nr:16S rRNA (cytosine(967)-C(5))-methyltransferase RsmB [Selenomonadaceae bacterium]